MCKDDLENVTIIRGGSLKEIELRRLSSANPAKT
jgi:hypothetical protein